MTPATPSPLPDRFMRPGALAFTAWVAVIAFVIWSFTNTGLSAGHLVRRHPGHHPHRVADVSPGPDADRADPVVAGHHVPDGGRGNRAWAPPLASDRDPCRERSLAAPGGAGRGARLYRLLAHRSRSRLGADLRRRRGPRAPCRRVDHHGRYDRLCGALLRRGDGGERTRARKRRFRPSAPREPA